jgi:O-acetyl-ADP-ribose deacetylase (regulator of RNase III)
LPDGRGARDWGLDLPAAEVIQAVGPIGRGGDGGEAYLLASCCRRAIEAARGFESVAFSATPTGVYGFPAPKAAGIAVATTAGALREARGALKRVVSCCFSQARRAAPCGDGGGCALTGETFRRSLSLNA